jgi:hypothetical protein
LYLSLIAGQAKNDPVLEAVLKNNEEGFRKCRAALALSPDTQVHANPPKYKVLSAKINLSQRLF